MSQTETMRYRYTSVHVMVKEGLSLTTSSACSGFNFHIMYIHAGMWT